MINFFANIFGYVLNFLYEIVGNFGIAIILFSILVKIAMLPISYKQQKTMKKSQELNNQMKQLQFKYKNDPEKLNQEILGLYKREKMSPFSGCLSGIVQIILLFSVFFLVKSPLTYMRKIDKNVIEKLEAVVQEDGKTSNYKEIAVLNYINKLKTTGQESDKNTDEFNVNDYVDKVYVNMDLFGIDLSKVPTEDIKNIKVLIIPALYVLSSFVSLKMTNSMQEKDKKDKNKNLIGDGSEKEKEKIDEIDAMQDINKNMSLFMPIMSISIAIVAPLGLALYWLMNNILMIAERLVLDKVLKKDKKEVKEIPK